MTWLKRDFKSIAIGIAMAIYVLVIATRPYISEPGVSHELIKMARESNDERSAGIIRLGEGQIPSFSDITERIQNQFPDLAKNDKERLAKLEAIVARIGWPTDKRVGAEANDAAILLARRAISGLSDGTLERVVALMKQTGADDQDVLEVSRSGLTDDYIVVRPQLENG